MHPNPAFRARDDAAWLHWATDIGFAHLMAATPAGPMVAHAPITHAGPRAVRFHIARANRLARHLDGAPVIASISAPDGYVSPGWYADGTNQVPTWNYVAAELEGTAHAIDEDALVAQLDMLATIHEPRVAPDRPWTRDKMDDARFRQMLGAITGFELRIAAIRGTTKLSQNKSADDRRGVIAGLEASGNRDLATTMAAAAAAGGR